MSTTATFEQRATAAGASLRAAFYEGDPMTAPTTYRPPSVETPAGPSHLRRNLIAAAAAVAVVAAGTAVITSGGTEERPLPPAGPPKETVVTGLLGVPQFPIRMTVPAGLVEVDEDPGTRAFSVTGEDGGVFVTALRSVAGTPASELPPDVTAAFAGREDLVVTDKRTVTVAGRSAQRFTLGIAPGADRIDVWCPIAEQQCFKLEATKPMDVLVVPTAAEPLWVGIEATAGSADAVTRLGQELIDGIELLEVTTVEVPGVSMTLPVGWRVDNRAERFIQAGSPENRSSQGLNLMAPASVVTADGTRASTPADLVAWLKGRAQIETQVLQLVDVGSTEASLVSVVPQAGSQQLWCTNGVTATDESACFNTGSETVLYLVIPTDAGPVVLERHAPEGPENLQPWIDAHLELIPAITVGG